MITFKVVMIIKYRYAYYVFVGYTLMLDITLISQKKMETEFSALLKVAEKTPGLYFSYDVNITLR